MATENLTAEQAVSKAIDRTIKEVVTKAYGPILADVSRHEGKNNLEKVAMQSVAHHFVETLRVAQKSQSEPTSMPPLNYSIILSLVIAIILAQLVLAIMSIIPLPIENWTWISVLVSLAVGGIAYFVTFLISYRKKV